MIPSDRARTVLKGRIKNEEGEWVWCRILPRQWDKAKIDSFCEIGVFDSEMDAHDRSDGVASAQMGGSATAEKGEGVSGVGGAGGLKSREGSSELALGVERLSDDGENDGSRHAIWSAPSTTWATSLLSARVSATTSSPSATHRVHGPSLNLQATREPSSSSQSVSGSMLAGHSSESDAQNRLGNSGVVEGEKTVKVFLSGMRSLGVAAWHASRFYTIKRPESYDVSFFSTQAWRSIGACRPNTHHVCPQEAVKTIDALIYNEPVILSQVRTLDTPRSKATWAEVASNKPWADARKVFSRRVATDWEGWSPMLEQFPERAYTDQAAWNSAMPGDGEMLGVEIWTVPQGMSALG